jgi:phosphoglycolate phosphatase-like HAD superfamily hydrolase
MSSRRLVIFDIDGTLTDTNAVDDRCFMQAVSDVLKLGPSPLDWSGSPHVTDSAIAPWCCEHYCGRPLDPAELAAIVTRFLALLIDARERDPGAFSAIRGACDLFAEARRAGWSVALATGGWRAPATFKLNAAGIDVGGTPLATADDAPAREDILRCALEQSLPVDRRAFDRVVSVGDGVWDVQAAAKLGWSFVAISPTGYSERLTAAGATLTFEDYSDAPAFLRALDDAPVPRSR